MKLLQYANLDLKGLKSQFNRTISLLEDGNFSGAEVKKLTGAPFYRAKLSDADRLLFRFGSYRGETYLLVLEIIRNHAYSESRFLRGSAVDESKLVPLSSPEPTEADDVLELSYVNPSLPRVHLLDKILSFDDLQVDALKQRPPMILIGSAGSGKTVLTLEKVRQLPGEVLYVTHSSFLTDNARTLYYAHHYENPDQEVSFLSFLEYVQSIAMPTGKPLTFREFSAWFDRHRAALPIKNAHPVFEEFNGVITGSAVTRPHLSLEEYLNLGIRRSIFTGDERPVVYELFRRYLAFLQTAGHYDLNIFCHELHAKCAPTYDFIVADEVQDLTAVQLSLILKSLRQPEQFVLCGDSNQIVHPNFFSWASVKSFFYEKRLNGHAEIIRILSTNYRNSPEITALANRLLLIKNARFGSIDRESHYLVRPISANAGCVEFLKDSTAVRRDINAKTRRSARFAVIVMREEDKPAARRSFNTPLIFSVQEAKGLEYENIILLNFVSDNARAFKVLTEGVTAADMQGDFSYARAKDKSDKSLEAYKFFVNALYVAVTRAVRNVYLLEERPTHPLLKLLALGESREGADKLAEQQSSREEWKEEARKLELQGKAEQVDAIHRSILHTEPVPWRVLTPDTVDAVAEQVRNRSAKPKTRRLLLDYASTYSVMPLIAELSALKFKPALTPDIARVQARRRYGVDYHQRGYRDLRRKIDRHGIDFRNPLNQTPLMLATQFGLLPLVEELVQNGANLHCADNWGRTPLQLALRAAYENPLYAKTTLGALYPLLLPAALKLRVGDHLVKIDSHRMEFFLLNSMLAMFQFILRSKIKTAVPAFETADFIHALAHFPDSVIPLRRKKRAAISAALAGNEVFRDAPRNRHLFVRVKRGFYIPNPCMAVELDNTWVSMRALLKFDHLEHETENPRLAHFLRMVRHVEQKVNAFKF